MWWTCLLLLLFISFNRARNEEQMSFFVPISNAGLVQHNFHVSLKQNRGTNREDIVCFSLLL